MLRGVSLDLKRRRSARRDRADGCGQVDARAAHDRRVEADGRQRAPRRRRSVGLAVARRRSAYRLPRAGHRTARRHGRRKHLALRRARLRGHRRGGEDRRRARVHSLAARAATTRPSAIAASCFRADSANASPCARDLRRRRKSSCSTSRTPASTPSAKHELRRAIEQLKAQKPHRRHRHASAGDSARRRHDRRVEGGRDRLDRAARRDFCRAQQSREAAPARQRPSIRRQRRNSSPPCSRLIKVRRRPIGPTGSPASPTNTRPRDHRRLLPHRRHDRRLRPLERNRSDLERRSSPTARSSSPPSASRSSTRRAASIRALHVEDGTKVKAGAVLVELDDAEALERYTRARDLFYPRDRKRGAAAGRDARPRRARFSDRASDRGGSTNRRCGRSSPVRSSCSTCAASKCAASCRSSKSSTSS